MARRITIIGGLPSDPDRERLLIQLRDRSGDDVEWDWIKADPPQYDVPKKPLIRLLGRFRNPRPGVAPTTVVKLDYLNGKVANLIHQAVSDPKLAPPSIEGVEDLIEWLFSPEANLIPRTEWFGNLVEAALAAVLGKLIRNKSWNKDTQGHAWTEQADLLGQSPVCRPGFDAIRGEAAALLDVGTLFLSKGGQEGKTPKEWCINLAHVPLVKRMMIARSLAQLATEPDLVAFHRRVVKMGQEQLYRIDGEIVNERVMYICRK